MHDILVKTGSKTSLQIDGLSKGYHGTRVVSDISLAVREGAYLALLGPSGCGKTTLLRLIAGLEHPDAGSIAIAGRIMVANGIVVPPEARGIGMVFQSYALWPHMSVAQNVGFALKLQGVGGAALKQRIDEALALVGLDTFGARKPAELSGGQRQRVALARALAARPRLLLLDEPLANLDTHLRDTMLAEFRRLHRDSGTTFIHVTHDQSEAMALATEIAVMEGGRLQQVDAPHVIYARPANSMVARFIGKGMVLPVEVAGADGHRQAMLCGRPLSCVDTDKAPAGRHQLCLRPEAVSLAPGAGSGDVEAIVRDCVYRGSHHVATVSLADDPSLELEVHVSEPVAVGQRLGLCVRSAWLLPQCQGEAQCA